MIACNVNLKRFSRSDYESRDFIVMDNRPHKNTKKI